MVDDHSLNDLQLKCSEKEAELNSVKVNKHVIILKKHFLLLFNGCRHVILQVALDSAHVRIGTLMTELQSTQVSCLNDFITTVRAFSNSV
jgi:hypothetical protein